VKHRTEHASSPVSGSEVSMTPLVLSSPLLFLLAVPVVLLAARTTPDAVATELAQRETRQAIGISLATSVACLVLAAVMGTPLALWLARSRTRFATLIETLVDLPTLLPPSVAGLSLLLALGRHGPVGALLHEAGIDLAFTPVAVILAQLFVAAPYYVRSATAGFASVTEEIREAATIDGATGWSMLRLVLVPQAGRSLAAGAVMCWSRALGEFGATMIFAGNLPGRTQTMPMAIYLGLEQNLDRALVLSAIMIGLSLSLLMAARLLASPVRPRG
jgi:molybdate transport system permease protein